MNIKIMKALILKLILQIEIFKLKKKEAAGEKVTYPKYEVKGGVLHHGAGDWDFERVNLSHKNRWGFKSSLGFYIGYNKFLGYDGVVHIGRRDGEQGAHTIGPIPYFHNRHYIGICLQGNTEEKEPTAEQLISLRQELDEYKKKGIEFEGHRDIQATLCPGKYLYEWLQEYKGH